ncbi:hypothetical protein [Massilia sp. S19_KUP03_FR1]|uniref:hypothetical protein n=1 Tax=Massilia sp. S19_KUP03_FR1 TaxID=3025503 RepID=UPI002FCDABDF
MNAPHQLVSLERATAGMVLSDAILDQQGQVLLAQGTVLTTATIAGLARHDIAALPIVVTGAVVPEPTEAAVTARLDYLFRGATATPDSATAILHGYIADFRLGREVAP